MSPLPTTANTARPKSLGYGALLNDLYLRLAVVPGRELTIETAPLEAPKVSTAENPEDIRNDFGELFSRADFSGGEGLDIAHRRDASPLDSTRFWSSKGLSIAVDDASRLRRVRLLRTTANVEAAADTNLHLAFDGTAVYMAEGTTVRRTTTPNAAVPVFADDDPHAGQAAVTVSDLATVGRDVYAALGASGLHKRDGNTGVWTELTAPGTFQPVKVWQAKGYLFAASGAGVLVRVNLASGAIAQTLATLPAGRAWTALADAGAAVLAAADDGYVYAYTDDGTGTLTLAGQSFVGPGEIPYALAAGHGPVFYGTRRSSGVGAVGRAWRAELDEANFVLTNSQLIRQWGHDNAADDTRDHAPRAMMAARNSVYLGVDEDDGAYLWRYDLTTTGRSRDLDAKAAGVVVDVLDAGDQLFFSVAGHGLRRESRTAYEAQGHLIGPLGDLFTSVEKPWVGGFLDHDEIASDTRVELYVTVDPAALDDPDSSSWRRVKNVTSGRDPTESPIPNLEGRYAAGMLKLYASADLTVTPAVRGFAFRAYPGEGDVLVDLPVNVSDQIEAPRRRRLRVKGAGRRVYERLRGQEGAYAELTLLHTDETLRGTVERVSTPIPALTARGSPTVVSMLRFRGRRVQMTGTSTSPAALGIGTLGIDALGGVE